MTVSSPPIALDLLPLATRGTVRSRRREPITVGVPLGRGVARDESTLRVKTQDGSCNPAQFRALDRWPDGSIRWLLIDTQLDAGDDIRPTLALVDDDSESAAPNEPVSVDERPDGVVIRTGALTFTFVHGAAFPLADVRDGGRARLDGSRSGLAVTIGNALHRYVIRDVAVHDAGPLRADLMVRASAEHDACPVEAFARVEIFAGQPTVRIGLTLRNPNAAVHPGGQWGLGDPGSVLLESAVVRFGLPSPVDRVHCVLEPGLPAEAFDVPFRVAQESSGGPHWNGPVHRDRDGRVPLRFPGYELSTPTIDRRGDRADPVVTIDTPDGPLSVTMPGFWANFPRSLHVASQTLDVGLFPDGGGTRHELQGGEQKTHTLMVCVGHDPVSASPLAWCHDPQRVYPSPDVVCAAGAVPCLLAAADDPSDDYRRLVEAGLDEGDGFFAKREAADEFGWRHFGDLPADHESAFQPPDRPFVSHYNNQYDALAGFAQHFLRTGDGRWWTLMADLADHVRDIDTYHTTRDRPLYNGGLFWHTDHYVDAGTSTHRTYPRGGRNGGGPSAEHNYNYGLMLHYFLTGDVRSKEAAIDLGRWVLRMDDGTATPLRWISRHPTGWASYTAGHHGPGRGAGHSILACLVAHQLSGDRRYLDKAEELIRRCLPTSGPVPMHFVDDVEGYWSYTAFLQAVGCYLHERRAAGATGGMVTWARQGLLTFARWMAEHERPYLERPDRLQFPTQTWAAQDLRKADVFQWAALETDGAERERFLACADRFFTYSVTTLPTLEGYRFTRPLVLVMTQGLRHGWFVRHRDSLPPPTATPAPLPPAPRAFRPQRTVALRRLLGGALLAVLLAVVALVRLLG